MYNLSNILNASLSTIPSRCTVSPELQIARAESFRYVGITIGVFAVIIGFVGNFLTIAAYFTTRKLQTGFHLFILNLSIVDLITATLMLPFNIAGYVQMKWPFGNNDFTSRLQAFSYFSCGYTSVSFLVAITINRLIGVIFPHKYDSIFRGLTLKVILLTCWLIAPAALLPFLVASDTCGGKEMAMTGFSTSQFLCTFICLNEWRPYMEFTRALFQLMPFILMIIVYSVIFLRRLKSFNKINKFAKKPAENKKVAVEKTISQSFSLKRKKSETNAASVRRQKSNKRLIQTSMTICAAFGFVFLPSVFLNFAPNSKCVDVRWHMICSNLSWFNCTINPIVYAILNPSFRKAYGRIIFQAIGKNVHSLQETTRNGSRGLSRSVR